MVTNTHHLPVSTYNPNEMDEDTVLRMSKSSYMLYQRCPRKYWWRYIALPDAPFPRTPEMIRGTHIHSVLEPLVENPQDVDSAFEKAAELGVAADNAVFASMEIFDQLTEQVGAWECIMAETKLRVYDPINNLVLTGAFDGLIMFENGDVALVEIKTGKWSDFKHNNTRKELAFYQYMLSLSALERSGIEELPMATHFLYIAPDAANEKYAAKMEKVKSKTVGFGTTQGMFVLEKINKRTITAFTKKFSQVQHGLNTKEWPIKWDDYSCAQWCDFATQCEPEMHGLTPDPTEEEE